MKKSKVGISLIVLGNLLYLAHAYFSAKNEASNFSDFSSGLLIGLSIGCNLIGIILVAAYIAENGKRNK